MALRSVLLLAAAMACAATLGAEAAAKPPPRRPPPRKAPVDPPADPLAPYSFGLWGDVPYSQEQITVGVPNLIADMNAHNLAFSVFNGDWKQGSNSPCDEALYNRSLGYLNALSAPAAFTPGDNDWTDCDRANNGGYNSLERLDYERKVFFSTEYTNGVRKLRQEVQTAPLCPGYSATRPYPLVPCVENRRWTLNGVVYMTPTCRVGGGSCNNLCDVNPDPEEFAGRNAANLAWLNETFAAATASGAAAVVLITQASPGWDLSDSTRAGRRDPRTLAFQPPRLLANGTAICGDDPSYTVDGYADWLPAVRTHAVRFARPVLYAHGDSHYFRVDKPLLDSKGYRLQNFTRLETPGNNAATGNNDVQWIKVNVDPRSREVFSFAHMVVPGNLPAAYAESRRRQAA
ncbi:hypothetical protein GPECTOR_18g185 [Gonium pectorale]|uniref:Calcineurin-like phosphoesterase domain-containing protein n=1 Tax=Gonium pectorale TaxID=33097 RepID=A0A150GJQ0_GONPE|nr:hypothetical protein GPECTOR_18g185 [Gonium pectorale]|eukprot:KXZ50033.1 hypothetical protein GPECTOR_18g185 [Gonium pectorale]